MVFNQKRDAIEAYLTIVFAALAISRRIQAKTGLSIRRFLNLLEPLRTGVLSLNGVLHEFRPEIDDTA